MTDYYAFIRLCQRTRKCLETERLLILSGKFGKISPLLEKKESLIHQVMEQAELLLDAPPATAHKSRRLAAASLREVIKAAEENSIVLSGALRGLKAGRARQTQTQGSLIAYTANGDYGLAAPLPNNSEALA